MAIREIVGGAESIKEDFTLSIAFRLRYEAEQDKFGRGRFTVHEAVTGPTVSQFDLVVTEEGGESAQVERYRVSVEKLP